MEDVTKETKKVETDRAAAGPGGSDKDKPKPPPKKSELDSGDTK